MVNYIVIIFLMLLFGITFDISADTYLQEIYLTDKLEIKENVVIIKVSNINNSNEIYTVSHSPRIL